ncbi:MAG TPA: RNase adapter RapZ [Candidatus Dormibacteraeota bacterium]|nr:RNase adapter RapZ [Candidatus Dormibacteraeota bacterium]
MEAPQPLWLLAGPTGSGRHTALEALRRAGVPCTEELPAALLASLARLERAAPAVVTLAGGGDPGGVRESGVRVLFLDCDDRTLVRRISESTRPHPCADAGSGMAAVLAERERLGWLRAGADAVVDTSELTPADLARRVVSIVAGDGAAPTAFTVTVSSFGFKHGPQIEADWVVDARFLPNPFWVPELRPRTGLDADVAAYVMASTDGPELVARLADLLGWAAERARARGRRHLHLAVGCTGGRHRSVAVAVALGERLRAGGTAVAVAHRDVDRPDPR